MATSILQLPANFCLEELNISSNNKERVESSQSAVGISSGQTFRNLFHDHKHIKFVNNGQDLAITLENVADFSCNLYMVLEWLVDEEIDKEDEEDWSFIIADEILQKLMELRKKKSWSPVHPGFLDTLMFEWGDNHKLMKCTDLISEENTVRVISVDESTLLDFVTTSAVYKFYMEHHKPCEKDSECGFLIEVTGLSQGEFEIKLVLDKDKYPNNLHLHDDICADRMHFVLERCGNDISTVIDYQTSWNNESISWSIRPEYEKIENEDIVMWNGDKVSEYIMNQSDC